MKHPNETGPGRSGTAAAGSQAMNASERSAPASASRTESSRKGDQVPPGTPGSGENVCPRCGGSGRIDGHAQCPECAGTGHVTTGIGGG